MNSRECTDAVHEAWNIIHAHPDLSNFDKNRVYKNRRNEIELEWKTTFLFEKYGEGLSTSVLEILFAYAWEQSHSRGYYEVEYIFEDLCDMQRKIQELTTTQS